MKPKEPQYIAGEKGKWQARRVPFEQYVRLALSHAQFSENEDGTWTTDVPRLPGCISWGETRSEAVEMIKDAIEAWVLTALRFGDELPEVDGCILQYAVDEPAPATP
jgi:predicted RNase H-like HicB family nuclease